MNTYIQFSIDDTISILKELTEKRPYSIFDIERFRFLKSLRDEYGCAFSMYAFFEDDKGFNLSAVTNEYKSEFIKHSNWLKYGVHSTNKNSSFADSDGVCEYKRIQTDLVGNFQ